MESTDDPQRRRRDVGVSFAWGSGGVLDVAVLRLDAVRGNRVAYAGRFGWESRSRGVCVVDGRTWVSLMFMSRLSPPARLGLR